MRRTRSVSAISANMKSLRGSQNIVVRDSNLYQRPQKTINKQVQLRNSHYVPANRQPSNKILSNFFFLNKAGTRKIATPQPQVLRRSHSIALGRNQGLINLKRSIVQQKPNLLRKSSFVMNSNNYYPATSKTASRIQNSAIFPRRQVNSLITPKMGYNTHKNPVVITDTPYVGSSYSRACYTRSYAHFNPRRQVLNPVKRAGVSKSNLKRRVDIGKRIGLEKSKSPSLVKQPSKSYLKTPPKSLLKRNDRSIRDLFRLGKSEIEPQEFDIEKAIDRIIQKSLI